jgi:hypothetical protein
VAEEGGRFAARRGGHARVASYLQSPQCTQQSLGHHVSGERVERRHSSKRYSRRTSLRTAARTRGSVRVPQLLALYFHFLYDAERNRRYSVVPWNAPLPLMLLSVALPLICGNTVVVRPSEICPHASSLVLDALHDVRKFI